VPVLNFCLNRGNGTVSSMTDYAGMVKPKRIVSLSPSNTEVLFAVSAGDRVVGVTDHCNYPDELESRVNSGETVRVGGYWDPSVDTILGLKPDLVFVSIAKCTVKTNNCKIKCSRRCEKTVNVANRLKSLGINVVILAPHSLDDVLNDILSVGNATGNATEAKALVDNLRQRINAVVMASKKISNRPKVYFEVWNDPYISVNQNTWIGNIIQLAGGKNVFADSATEWPLLSSEDIIERNPDVLVFPVVPGVPRFWGSFEDVKKRQGWSGISAVKEGILYEVERDLISRPGPRLVKSLELLGKIICSAC
jgi:iron complex transport system substrate-binding protein